MKPQCVDDVQPSVAEVGLVRNQKLLGSNPRVLLFWRFSLKIIRFAIYDALSVLTLEL